MQTMVQKAVLGDRKAMEKLYHSTKQKVFYVCKLLLQDEILAETATIWVFRFGWTEMKTLEIRTEDEFAKFVVQRAVGYCKKVVLRRNSKAFHVPANKNFNITRIPSQIGTIGNVEDTIFARFSDLQRFILVLNAVAWFNKEELSKTVNLKNNILKIAMETEKKNIENILKDMQMDCELSYRNVMDDIVANEYLQVVPERVDEEVAKVIALIVEPIEREKTRRRNRVIVAVAAGCMMIWIFTMIMLYVL